MFGPLNKNQPNQAGNALLLYPASNEQKASLLQTSIIAGIKVKISNIESNWERKGIVYNIPTEMNKDPKELQTIILEELGVEDFKCIPVKNGEVLTLIITFPTKIIPRTLLING